jgi:hypothetical protein
MRLQTCDRLIESTHNGARAYPDPRRRDARMLHASAPIPRVIASGAIWLAAAAGDEGLYPPGFPVLRLDIGGLRNELRPRTKGERGRARMSVTPLRVQ